MWNFNVDEKHLTEFYLISDITFTHADWLSSLKPSNACINIYKVSRVKTVFFYLRK
jgi:hypothetical protein